MAISFPANPSTNQTYSYANTTWVYDGTSWLVQSYVNLSGKPNYVTVNVPGTIVSPLTGTNRYYPPAAITLSKVYASLGTAASGTFSFILKKNGTDTGYTFNISNASFTLTPVTVNISVATTDYLTLDVTSGSASDLRVEIQFS